jgi:hypothetical protein
LRQGGLQEVGSGIVEQVTELKLSRPEGLRSGIGDQQVSDLPQQFFGARPQDFDQTLDLGLLLLGQWRQSHG